MSETPAVVLLRLAREHNASPALINVLQRLKQHEEVVDFLEAELERAKERDAIRRDSSGGFYRG